MKGVPLAGCVRSHPPRVLASEAALFPWYSSSVPPVTTRPTSSPISPGAHSVSSGRTAFISKIPSKGLIDIDKNSLWVVAEHPGA